MRFRNWKDRHGEHYQVDGKEVTKEEYDSLMEEARSGIPKVKGGKPGDSLVAWKRPIESMAAQCHPKQVEEYRESLHKKGICVDVTPDGKPVFTNSRQRKKFLKSQGLHDNNGGYGDG